MQADHTSDAVRRRLASTPRQGYLRDFVYGGIDGAVTTFAVVSGVAGAELSNGIIIVLGIANLIGDGFSMAAGNFLASRAELQVLAKTRQTEQQHIAQIPEGEREEVRQIMSAKGFDGAALENAVQVLTSDEELWVNTMLQEEHGLSLNRPHPWKAAAVTFVAFCLVGSLPLVAFVLNSAFGLPPKPFLTSTILTAAAFFAVGTAKSRFVSQKWYWSGLETLAVGGAAAAIAYFIGAFLATLVDMT